MNYSSKSNIYKTVEIKCAKTRENVLVVFGLMLFAILVAFSLLLSPRKVVGSSMYPTLNSSSNASDIVYIIKQTTYRRGDIVVLEKNNTQSSSDVIKRVIGLAGEKISIKKDLDGYYKIFINDKVYEENYISSKLDMQICYNHFKSYLSHKGITEDYITVNKGEIFVLGDNRGVSLDSSVYGTRKVSEVEGRVLIVIPDSNRFFSLKIIW